jgi:hypothetical protein
MNDNHGMNTSFTILCNYSFLRVNAKIIKDYRNKIKQYTIVK